MQVLCLNFRRTLVSTFKANWLSNNPCSIYGRVPTDQATGMAATRHVGAPGRLIIWRPLNRHSSNSLGLGQGWRKTLKAYGQIADNFWKSSFARGKPMCTRTYFRLWQLRLSNLGSCPTGPPLLTGPSRRAQRVEGFTLCNIWSWGTENFSKLSEEKPNTQTARNSIH